MNTKNPLQLFQLIEYNQYKVTDNNYNKEWIIKTVIIYIF